LGRATFSGRGPRQTTRVGSIGVLWTVVVGGILREPTGEVGETLLESERVIADGAKVSGECGECGETGEWPLPLLIFDGARRGRRAGGGATVMGEGKSKARVPHSGCGERGDGSASGRELVFP
jgi:hypothetical protein